ncbi:MAG: helix-turn-helix domain-containing protein [Ferruginibacter sp.]
MLSEYQKNYTLVNPANGNLAFKVYSFEDINAFDHLQRLNYYSMILIRNGKGKLKADFAEFDFSENVLMCFAPYQPFMIETTGVLDGFAINFHPDFFCIHKHQKEVACNGVLFNDIYNPPFVILKPADLNSLYSTFDQMKTEMQNIQLAQYELLVSYLKIFLITASRLKINQTPGVLKDFTDIEEPFIVQHLKDAIDKHFKTKHTANDYALLLNVSSKTLAKTTKAHFNKTLTRLIAERIIIEAKRELYLTSKRVKEIAYELGYEDEYYFSRFFKANAEVSPQLYRDTVGFARAEA